MYRSQWWDTALTQRKERTKNGSRALVNLCLVTCEKWEEKERNPRGKRSDSLHSACSHWLVKWNEEWRDQFFILTALLKIASFRIVFIIGQKEIWNGLKRDYNSDGHLDIWSEARRVRAVPREREIFLVSLPSPSINRLLRVYDTVFFCECERKTLSRFTQRFTIQTSQRVAPNKLKWARRVECCWEETTVTELPEQKYRQWQSK